MADSSQNIIKLKSRLKTLQGELVRKEKKLTKLESTLEGLEKEYEIAMDSETESQLEDKIQLREEQREELEIYIATIQHNIQKIEENLAKSQQADSNLVDRLYKYFIKFNYLPQKQYFKSYLDKKPKIASFILHGNGKADQEWLWGNVFPAYPEISGINTDAFKAKLWGNVYTTHLIHSLLSFLETIKIGIGIHRRVKINQVEDAIELFYPKIKKILQDRSLILPIVISEGNPNQTFLKDFFSKFWKPLHEKFDQDEAKSDFWLLLFLIDEKSGINDLDQSLFHKKVNECISNRKPMWLKKIENAKANTFMDWLTSGRDEADGVFYHQHHFTCQFSALEDYENYICDCATIEDLFEKICHQLRIDFIELVTSKQGYEL